MEHSASAIIFSLPDRFLAKKAGDYNARFHFCLKGKGGGNFTVIVANGMCWVYEGLHGEPDCTVNVQAETYAQIETGQIDPQTALMSGKIEVSHLSPMMAFSKLFKRFSSSVQDTNQPGANTPQAGHRKPQKGPLKGLRIVDLTRLLPGPLATMMMADMGAEVIKVEDMNAPDAIRNFPPFADDQSVNYLALNRSKKSMAVDFYTNEGLSLVKQLVREADVLIEQFRPGVIDKMGLGYDELSKQNQKLILVSLSGYGRDGPCRDLAGHDLNYISTSGLLSLNVDENGKPVMPGFQIADVAGGSYMAVNATLAAVVSRQTTGKGQHVDVSMMDGVMPLMALADVQYWSAGVDNKNDMQLSGGLANYNVYECADGRYVALGALEPKFWRDFCRMVARPDWESRIADQSKENMDALKADVQDLVKTKRRDDWLSLAKDYDCCLSPVNTLNEAKQDPHIQHRQMVHEQQTEGGTDYRTFGVPAGFPETPAQMAWQAPLLGEDTNLILQEIGYEEKDIEDLIGKGVIK